MANRDEELTDTSRRVKRSSPAVTAAVLRCPARTRCPTGNPHRVTTTYQRSTRGPANAPTAPESSIPSEYHNATKVGETSGHDKA